MKKSLVALAALAATSAFAQSSVTVYGNLDQAMYRQTDNGVTYSKIGSNLGSTSTLGFRGNEDLGGGTSAYFHLLSELSLSEGQMGSTTSGNAAASGQKPNIFTRAANVGLKDNTYGSFEIGRLQDVVWQTQGALNNTNLNSFGWSAYTAMITNTGGSSTFNPSTAAGRATGAGTLANFNGLNPTDSTFYGTTGTSGTANSADTGSAGINFAAGWSYISPKLFNTTTVTYQHFGQNFGNNGTTSNATAAGQGLRVQYENGPLNAQFATTTRNGSDGNTAWRNNTYGVTYQLGAYKLIAAQSKDKFQGTLSNLDNITVNGIGVSYDVNPKIDVAVGYTTVSDDQNSAYTSKVTALTARYKFSKRTLVYAGMGHEANQGANNYTSMFYGGPGTTSQAAASSNGYLVGIRHMF